MNFLNYSNNILRNDCIYLYYELISLDEFFKLLQQHIKKYIIFIYILWIKFISNLRVCGLNK